LVDRGTPPSSDAGVVVGAGALLLRELNDEMNSSAGGASPRRFFRCSAAASFDKLLVYVMMSLRELSSSGKSR
jgi:hypothetical protein